MRALAGLIAFGSMGVVAAALAACEPSCEDTLSCQPHTRPGDGGENDDGSLCDRSKDPSEQACLVTNNYAIFVAPGGQDAGAGSGTRTDPARSITQGIELAKASGKFVIVCNATYDESVKLTAGAKIYGGFTCPNAPSPWTYEAGSKAKVAPAARGPALEIQNVSDQVWIADIEFASPTGGDPSESSIAAVAVGSPKITLQRVRLAAGAGVNGASAKTEEFTFPGPDDLIGNNGTGAAGGAARQCTCPDGTTTQGGQGGAPVAEVATASGANGLPDYPGKGGEGGNPLQTCGSGGTGQDGASAPPVTDGVGASTFGSVSSETWSSAIGAAGANGAPGQGGGGGAGVKGGSGGGGGGGGCGGCGGKGGKGGGGGGASIALLAIDSPVSLQTCALETASGGNGGNGAVGQSGQNPGSKGNGFADACQGGKGGHGGNGGNGGGGAGGISVGIVYKGQKPTSDATTTVTTGTAGSKGLGGIPGTNDGIDGVAQPNLEVP